MTIFEHFSVQKSYVYQHQGRLNERKARLVQRFKIKKRKKNISYFALADFLF